MNKSKVSIAVSKIVSFVLMLAGIAIVFICSVGAIVYMTQDASPSDVGAGPLIICFIVGAFGAWLIVLSRNRTKLMERFRQYVSVISNYPDGYIPDIAAALGKPEEVVKNNLDLMVTKGYFVNAFVDRSSNHFVIAAKQNNTVSESQAMNMVTVKCRGCGGINTIQKGTVGECIYCGSSIKGD